MAEPVVAIRNLNVRRGRAQVLRGINLELRGGEFMGVLGPNGAGKTTLLNVIAGFEQFTGDLTLFGDRARMRRTRAQRLRVGLVPQLRAADPAFPITAREVVMTGCAGRAGLLRAPNAHMRRRAGELMDLLRVSHAAGSPIGWLSGGERQKVALARALLQEPDLLLLDEPTAGLDMAVRREVMDLLCDIHARMNPAIVLVTHDFDMLPPAMRRAVLMRGGAIVHDAPVRDVLTDEHLSGLYETGVHTFMHQGRRYISYD
jgi:ABC-type Mn2+/Zn2+ transport system ATPase subunit